MFRDVADAGLSVFRKVTDLWNGARADSLIDYTRVARVEPITLIDNDLMFYEDLGEVTQSLQAIFSGYYLQAIAISTNVGNVETMRHLDKLNPSRSVVDSATNSLGWVMATEAYKHRLPTYDQITPALEAMVLGVDTAKDKADHSVGLGRDTLATSKELSNLSVGKMLAVEITDGKNSATIPVSIRLIATALPSDSLIHILSVGNQDTSVKERYHAWRAGRLEFIRDLVMCQDLIDAHTSNLMSSDQVYSNMLKRRKGNRLSTLVSGNPSVATASNLAVISSTSAEALELKVNGKLSSFNTRQKIFEATYLMILVVVDKEWGQVTFYHRGIPQPSQLSIRDLKSANKGTGPDVGEILKAYRLGSAPSL